MQVLSLGSALDLWSARAGSVHSVFSGAVNLRVEDELWTVLSATRQDCPFGIRVAVDHRHRGFGVGVGELVQIRAGCVRLGHLVLDCRAAPRWTPAPWAEPLVGLARRLAVAERAARERAWIGSVSLAAELRIALCANGPGADAQLAGAVRRTVGSGPGLTPAGDDVLVGMFTALLCSDQPTGRTLASRLARALAPALHSTTDISRHLLTQAARGLPGRALHELGRTLHEDAPDDVVRIALARVLDTGASSGADACIGLLATLQFLLPAERIAA